MPGIVKCPILHVFSRTLPHFVDEYLSYLCEVHPTNATFDGVHLHDDLLEDLGRPAIDAQVRARRLRPAAGRHRPGAPDRHRAAGAAGARRQHPIVELEAVRTWERSPQHYSDILATSLAGQAPFATRRWPSARAASSRSFARCRG